jgi:hypothetical protein
MKVVESLTAGLRTNGSSLPYAPAQHVAELSECWFYHTIDLPGHGTVKGDWDLRAGLKDYCGHYDLNGKRVLEIGTASGYLCFAMEQMGADVLAVELPPDQINDFVPWADIPDVDGFRRWSRQGIDRMRNSFWLSHRLLQSKSRVLHASVYDLPANLGTVDVSTFGAILLHLRDPFLALANALRFTREAVIVTNMIHEWPWEQGVMGLMPERRKTLRKKLSGLMKKWVGRWLGFRGEMIPSMVFLPAYQAERATDTWWFFTPALVQQFLAVLGFGRSQVTYHKQIFRDKVVPMYTIVGQRTVPMPKRVDGPYPWY